MEIPILFWLFCYKRKPVSTTSIDEVNSMYCALSIDLFHSQIIRNDFMLSSVVVSFTWLFASVNGVTWIKMKIKTIIFVSGPWHLVIHSLLWYIFFVSLVEQQPKKKNVTHNVRHKKKHTFNERKCSVLSQTNTKLARLC